MKRDCGKYCRVCDIWNNCLSYFNKILIIFECLLDYMNLCKFANQEIDFNKINYKNKKILLFYLIFILTDVMVNGFQIKIWKKIYIWKNIINI